MSEFPFRDEDFVNNKQQNKFSSLFNSFKQNNQQNKQESKVSKMFGDIKGKIQNSNAVQSISNKGEQIQQFSANWQYFAFFFILGLFCMLLSTLYLPFIILMPAKFSSAFTLGSVNILISVSILKGTQNFFKSLFTKEKMLISLSYFITIFGTLYFSIIHKSYILVLIFASLQVFSLIWLLVSNFPGGVKGMTMITKKLFSCIKTIFLRMCGYKQYSFLPF